MLIFFDILTFRNKKKSIAALAFDHFNHFKEGHSLTEYQLKLAADHVCLNLNNPNGLYRYFYNMYCYITKCNVVLEWKKKHNGYKLESKFGEVIFNNKLVNFLEDDEHKNCSCSSVYYKFY